MTKEKLYTDSKTLHRFLEFHCEREHHDVPKKEGILEIRFQEERVCEIKHTLCEECEALLVYGYGKLKECPHENKPSCRKCPNPCYEKPIWKKMAHIMMYSGMRLGLTKMRKILFK